MADFLPDFTNTIQEIRHAETPGTFVRQRILANAESLSNAATIQGAIEIANESLCKLASILYDTVDRQLVNIDSRTYRLLVPAPWGDSGYSKWGMRAVEARILRACLMRRVMRESTDALFDYADRRWFLNAGTYKTSTAALGYLKSRPISAAEWMKQANAWHDKEQQRWHNKGKGG